MSSNKQHSAKDRAFEDFFNTYYKVIMQRCERSIGNYAAEESTSTAFMMLYEHWDSIENPIPSVLFSWVYTVSKRLCIHYKYEREKWNSPDTLRDIWESMRNEAQSCRDNYEMMQLIDQTRKHLDSQERLLLAFLFENQDDETIAKHFGISEMAVRKRKERLVKKIKKCLGKK